MFCKYCGKEIDNTAKFCNYCGKKLNDAQNEIEINYKKIQVEKDKSENNEDDIMAILKENKTYNITLKSAIKDAQQMLMDNEKVSYAFCGNLTIMATNQSLKTEIFDIKGKVAGVIVITNKRIYFCSNLLGKKEIREVLLKDVISVDSSNTFGVGVLRVKALTETIEVTVNQQTEKKVKELIYEYKERNDSSNNSNIQNISIADEILKFKNLLDQGIITEEEFEEKKKDLLK